MMGAPVIGPLVASLGPLSSPPLVLVAMIASIVLLGVRAWAGVSGINLVRRVSLLLNLSIIAMTALFLAFVIIRFKILA